MRLVLGIFLGVLLTTTIVAQETGCIEGDCENGYGVYKTSTYTYYGSFLEGKKHFWGCQDYESSKQLYCGNYSEGDKHLFGTYYFYDGDNDFFMGLYDRGKQLRTGFYIDASAAENGAISMRRDEVHIKTKYNEQRNGTGCVAGDCENGNGIFITDFGTVLEGSFSNGEPNGWMCIQKLNGWEEHITEVECGSILNDGEQFTQYKFKTNDDMMSVNKESGEVKNTADFEMGIFDFYLKLGIHTGDPRSKKGQSLQYKTEEIAFGEPKLSGASNQNDYRCISGNCKTDDDGYAVKSNYNNADWFGYQFYGNYANEKLNGYACQYFPRHPKIDNKVAQSEYLYCGNFIDGTPKYFGASFYEGYEGVAQNFYFGLHNGYTRANHGVIKYKNAGQGWLLETANFED